MTRALAVGLVVLAGLGAPVSPSHARSASQPDSTTSSAATEAPKWSDLSRRFGGAMADTKPSRSSMMRFAASTEVSEISVKPGQRVEKGFVMIRARDNDLKAALELQEIQAANENEIKSAEQALRKAKSLYENGKQSGNLSPSEEVSLEVDHEQAKLQHAQAIVNLAQQKLKLKQLQGQYEHYRLEAPFNGVVEDVKVDVGQGVNEQADVIRVVDTATLWLEPAPQIDETLRLNLKEGSAAWALVDLPGIPPVLVEGKVVFVSSVADSASLTRRVRVEIKNLNNWPAGTLARVRFEKPAPEWDQYRPKTASAAAP